ncbi:MAG: hypothetical protein AB1791_07865 [Chloroflexota bacterium]
MDIQSSRQHPADTWQAAARDIGRDGLTRLRLAAMAGHIRQDAVAARRAALIDLLSDGRPHAREAIWLAVEEKLSKQCWGKRPTETLLRDLRALARGGLRIAYSRRPGAVGYYLEYPPLQRPEPALVKPIDWQWIETVRSMSVAEKHHLAFAAADLALQQKRALAQREHPEWTAEEVESEARRLVYRG